jgi:hypothetical protein
LYVHVPSCSKPVATNHNMDAARTPLPKHAARAAQIQSVTIMAGSTLRAGEKDSIDMFSVLARFSPAAECRKRLVDMPVPTAFSDCKTLHCCHVGVYQTAHRPTGFASLLLFKSTLTEMTVRRCECLRDRKWTVLSAGFGAIAGLQCFLWLVEPYLQLAGPEFMGGLWLGLLAGALIAVALVWFVQRICCGAWRPDAHMEKQLNAGDPYALPMSANIRMYPELR